MTDEGPTDGAEIIPLQRPIYFDDEDGCVTLAQYWDGERNFVEVQHINIPALIQRLQQVLNANAARA